MLPLGTKKVNCEVCHQVQQVMYLLTAARRQEYEEVVIPPARPVPPRSSEHLIPVSELDSLCKGSFPVGPIMIVFQGR
jgi:hypothetical protein